MFKANKKYMIVLAVSFTALILLQLYSPKPINWSLSYVKNAKIPYGTSALYKMLKDIFPNQTITDAKLPAYNILKDANYNNHNYIIINTIFEPDTLDTRELLKFAAHGNTIFIAANYFSGKFADTLKLKTDNYIDFSIFPKKDSTQLSAIYKTNDTVKVNFTNPELQHPDYYIYNKGFEGTYFNSFDTAQSCALGKNSNDKINFIRTHFGKGYIYINTLPEAFSNYHFVSVNYSYVYRALSCLPIQSTIWDEYYKAGNVKSDSPLRVIFNNPLLLKAYYLLLISLILFMVFGAKRKQRIIPVIEPYKNTTLQFIDIVGTLYYQTGNHKNIADKKIIYFLEYIRTAFQVKTAIYDEAFITRIANLSGIEYQQVHNLFYYFSDLSIKQTITEDELLKLNTMIENFHQQSKR